MKDPLVSIGIPTWNRGHFLKEVIDSVTRQTYSNLEIIICDNASTDCTAEIVRGIKDDRIRYFRNDRNIGQFPNWNLCLAKANGRYFKILQSDDKLAIEFLAKTVPILEANHSISIVLTGQRLFGDKQELGLWTGIPMGETCVLRGEERFLALKSLGFTVQPTLNIYPRDLARVLGGYSSKSSQSLSADFVLWTRLLSTGDVAIINAPLAYQRIHSAQERRCTDTTGALEDVLDTMMWLAHEHPESGIVKKVCRTMTLEWSEAYLWYGLKAAMNGRLRICRKVLGILYSHGLLPAAGRRWALNSPFFLKERIFPKRSRPGNLHGLYPK